VEVCSLAPVCLSGRRLTKTHVTRPDTPVQPHPHSIAPPATVEVVGVPLAVIDYEKTLEWMEAMVAARATG
jgi:hypothetical protein